MIFVDGNPFFSSSSSSTSSSGSRTSDLLAALLEHPILVSATRSFKSIEERKVSGKSMDSKLPTSSSNPKYVYLFQREYATVDPSLVHVASEDLKDYWQYLSLNFISFDLLNVMCAVEYHICHNFVGVAIRNRKNGMTSVAHTDSPKVVDIGFSQMLKLVVDHDLDADLDVHLVGGFEDVPPDHSRDRSKSKGKRVDENAYPVFNGFLVETSSGSIIPGGFDRTSRCPDEIVRKLRVSASYEDPSWNGKLLDTYDTKTDRFIIAPCIWTNRLVKIVKSLQSLSDSEILTTCSTSPLAEGPDFVENEKRLWDYLINHQNWQETFPMAQPRVFERTDEGGWERVVRIKIH
ncbi:N-terminal asparagine amidohydrolase family protein, putative isoform 2 [Hibiscus syriacus]|uniref:N-terminal asparagine amidohydrolase family protein, putative isoform 2 n=1 Tax=Hibiscus syriacus TaxID=106335 RepID=A0A6A2YFD2_HIBSY|nr:N-terminal asparagine amidohydrolase family protein, putative isoform 2 [Hibiscus syriacus]